MKLLPPSEIALFIIVFLPLPITTTYAAALTSTNRLKSPPLLPRAPVREQPPRSNTSKLVVLPTELLQCAGPQGRPWSMREREFPFKCYHLWSLHNLRPGPSCSGKTTEQETCWIPGFSSYQVGNHGEVLLTDSNFSFLICEMVPIATHI